MSSKVIIMYISIAKSLLCYLFILSVLLCSNEVLSRPNDRTCTADINQYGFPSNCSCPQFQRYDFHSGKCRLLTPSQKLSDLQHLLTNAESEIRIIESKGLEGGRNEAIKKLPQYFSGIAHYMRNLTDTYQFPVTLVRKAQHAANIVFYDIEFCSNDMMSECTEILEQLKLTIVELNNVVNTKDLAYINHADSLEAN